MKKKVLSFLLVFLMVVTSLQPVLALSSDDFLSQTSEEEYEEILKVNSKSNNEKKKVRFRLVKFFVDGNLYDQISVREGDQVQVPDEPTKEGYKFSGWLDRKDNPFDFSQGIYKNTRLYGSFEPIEESIKIDPIGPRTFEDGAEVIIPLFVRDENNEKVQADFQIQGLPEGLILEGEQISGSLAPLAWEEGQREKTYTVSVRASFKGAEASEDFSLTITRKKLVSIDEIGPRTFEEGDQVIIPLFVRNEFGEKVQADFDIQGLPEGLSLENEAIVGTINPLNWEKGLEEKTFNVSVKASFQEVQTTENFDLTVKKRPVDLPPADVLDVNLNERPDGTDKNGREMMVFGHPEFLEKEDGNTVVKFDGKKDGLRYTTDKEVYNKMNQDDFAVELYYRPLAIDENKRDPFGNTENAGFGFENTDGRLEFWAHLDGKYRIVGEKIENKKWVHIVGTYDKENLNFYVNGELKDSIKVGGDLKTPPTYMFLGGDTTLLGKLQRPDKAEISLARVYSTGLNKDQVRELFYSVDKIEDQDEDDSDLIVEGEDSGSVRFGVISDIHVGPGRPRQSTRTKKALDFFAANDANTTFVVGDITNTGTEPEYRELKSVLDRSNTKDMSVHLSMGNHEGGSRSLYKKYIESEENVHYKINGYHFIKVSPDGTQWPGSYTQISKWLSKELEVAKNDTGDKPIFVFFHHPIKDTYYVTEEWYGNMQKDVFNDYPMAVTFSGHIHSPNNHPRSIWQENFTAINTVSLYYFEMESGYGKSTKPPKSDQCSQGMLIDVEGSKVTIRNYDFISDSWIDQTWTFDTSKPEEFPYTDARYDLALAPEFEKDTKVNTSPSFTKVKVSFDQAKIPAEDKLGDIVHSYEFEIYKKSDKSRLIPAHKSKEWSNFHLLPMAKTFETEFSGLKPGTDYVLLITPVDAFKKKGQPLEVEFRTLGIGEDKEPEEDKPMAETYEPELISPETIRSYFSNKEGEFYQRYFSNWDQLPEGTKIIPGDFVYDEDGDGYTGVHTLTIVYPDGSEDTVNYKAKNTVKEPFKDAEAKVAQLEKYDLTDPDQVKKAEEFLKFGAQKAVDKLPAGEEKDALQERIDKVLENIEEAKNPVEESVEPLIDENLAININPADVKFEDGKLTIYNQRPEMNLAVELPTGKILTKTVPFHGKWSPLQGTFPIYKGDKIKVFSFQGNLRGPAVELVVEGEGPTRPEGYGINYDSQGFGFVPTTRDTRISYKTEAFFTVILEKPDGSEERQVASYLGQVSFDNLDLVEGDTYRVRIFDRQGKLVDLKDPNIFKDPSKNESSITVVK